MSRGSKCWKEKGAPVPSGGQPGRSPSPEQTRSLLPLCFMTTPSPLSSPLCPRNPARIPITLFPGETLIQLQGNVRSALFITRKRRPAASAENTHPRFGSNRQPLCWRRGKATPHAGGRWPREGKSQAGAGCRASAWRESWIPFRLAQWGLQHKVRLQVNIKLWPSPRILGPKHLYFTV